MIGFLEGKNLPNIMLKNEISKFSIQLDIKIFPVFNLIVKFLFLQGDLQIKITIIRSFIHRARIIRSIHSVQKNQPKAPGHSSHNSHTPQPQTPPTLDLQLLFPHCTDVPRNHDEPTPTETATTAQKSIDPSCRTQPCSAYLGEIKSGLEGKKEGVLQLEKSQGDGLKTEIVVDSGI